MRGKQIEGFVTREQALRDFFAAWEPEQRAEQVPLGQASGRVSAAEVRSVLTLPVYRISACDGIAVSAARFQNEKDRYSGWREGVDFARADTGDDFDDRFDAVIPIEEVDFAADGGIAFISPDLEIEAGANVRPRGSTLREGDLLLEANLPIRPMDLASLAMGGAAMIPVWRKPRVAFIPTGSELVPPGSRPRRGENIDSNSVMVRHMLPEFGAEPLVFPIVPDVPEALERCLREALRQADIVIMNAGTAKGSEDFSARLLGASGRLIHHYIAAAPGRPMALAVVDKKPVINLPGPAMAAFFGMAWCVRASVNRFLNVPNVRRQRIVGRLTEDIRSTPHMATLIRIDARQGADGYEFQPLSFHRAGLPLCLISNAMYVCEVGECGKSEDDSIEAELLRGAEYLEGRG